MSLIPSRLKGALRSHIVKPHLAHLIAVLLLAACGDATPADTPVPPPPTSVASESTPTAALSSPPPAAADVTLPPPPTLAPVPTSTATATPIATATATPTPTAEAVVLMDPADFGDDRNPLTGEIVEDASLLQRRPIAVKLSNSPAQFTRPQSGLNDADWVYEHVTEGNITRFTAILYGRTPPRVGPIRSARLIDVELPAMYDAALAFSGASAGVTQRINRSDFTRRVLRAAPEGYYRTGENKPYEHTLYGLTEGFWAAIEDLGQNVPPTFNTSLAFTSEPPPGGTPAPELSVDYRWTLVEWRYDPETGRYLRWSDGEIHRDANTDEQVTAANVIVVRPLHVLDPSICEEIRNGQCVHLSVQIQLWGSGTAFVFRDGRRYDVTWLRINREDLLTFTTADGAPFPLQLGNSWVQVVPSWLSNALNS